MDTELHREIAQPEPVEVILKLKHKGIWVYCSSLRLVYAHARDQICRLHFTENEKFTYSYNLKTLETLLLETGSFMRLHRSYLVAHKHIKGHTNQQVHLHCGTRLPLSKAARKAVEELLMKAASQLPLA